MHSLIIDAPPPCMTHTVYHCRMIATRVERIIPIPVPHCLLLLHPIQHQFFLRFLLRRKNDAHYELKLESPMNRGMGSS